MAVSEKTKRLLAIALHSNAAAEAIVMAIEEAAGPAGPTGAAGEMGPTGPTGADGATGPTGPAAE